MKLVLQVVGHAFNDRHIWAAERGPVRTLPCHRNLLQIRPSTLPSFSPQSKHRRRTAVPYRGDSTKFKNRKRTSAPASHSAERSEGTFPPGSLISRAIGLVNALDRDDNFVCSEGPA